MIYEKYVKDNSFVSKNKGNPNLDLISCIIKTREDLVTANNNYEFADGDLIDYYLYQIKATQSKYNYLLKKAKETRHFSKYARTNRNKKFRRGNVNRIKSMFHSYHV